MLTAAILVLLSCASAQLADGQCTHGDIRLEGGRDIFEGRVEVCVNGTWGTVCDDLWNRDNAKVVCRQLGFSTSSPSRFREAYFGEGSGPIHLDNVQCDGDEKQLIDCPHITMHNCRHTADAGVECNRFLTLPGPENVNAISSDTTTTISWRPPEQESVEGFDILFFITECFQNSSIINSNAVPVTDNTTYSVQVDDLFPSTRYECCVSAVYVYHRMINRERFTSSVSCVSTVTNPAEEKLTTIPTTATTESTTTRIVKTTLFPPKDSVTDTIASKGQSSTVTGGILGFIITVLVAMVIVMGVGLGYLKLRQRQGVRSKPRTAGAKPDPLICNSVYDIGAQRMATATPGTNGQTNDDFTVSQYSSLGPTFNTQDNTASTTIPQVLNETARYTGLSRENLNQTSLYEVPVTRGEREGEKDVIVDSNNYSYAEF